MSMRLACVAVVLVLCGACASGSPTSATAVTLADFHGQYSGTYNVANCSADGAFVGFCEGAGFTAGTTLPIVMSLTQSQGAVNGNVTLGSVNGTLQGTVSAGTLSGRATMLDVTNHGFTLTSAL